MTKDQSAIGIQAAMLCCGYNVGYYTTADIESWAVRKVDALDSPPIALLDLLTLRDMNPIDIMNLLRSLGDSLSPSQIIEMQIGFLGLLYDGKRIPLRSAIGGLWGLVHDKGVTTEQQSMIYWLDDAYDLAVAGTYGTMNDVDSEFLSFVRPYAEKIRTLEDSI